jgi:hypothetical protein
VILAGCFLLAAIAKSAQVPLAPWLARAMEGPTPSSALFYGAVMVHAGVYLVLRLQPLFEQSPVADGGRWRRSGWRPRCTAFVGGLAQTDIKSALIFATTGQVGLMFLACGLGFWRLGAAASVLSRGLSRLSVPQRAVDPAPTAGTRPPGAGVAGAATSDSTRRRCSGSGWKMSPTGAWCGRCTGWRGYLPIVFDTAVVDRATGLPAPAVQVPCRRWPNGKNGNSVRGRVLERAPDAHGSGAGRGGRHVPNGRRRPSIGSKNNWCSKPIGQGIVSSSHRHGLPV